MSEKTEQGFDVKETYNRFEQWFNNNRKMVYIVLGSIAGVIALFVGYTKFYQEPRTKKAYAEMRFAEYTFAKYISAPEKLDSLKLALNGDKVHKGFLQIISSYSGTGASNLAHAYAGIIYMRDRKFKEATEQLEKFDGKDQIVSPEITGLLGDAYSELNDFDKALDYYKKAAYANDNMFTSPVFLKRAGQLSEKLKKYDDAKKYYDEIKLKYQGTTEAQDIDKYIARVETELGS